MKNAAQFGRANQQTTGIGDLVERIKIESLRNNTWNLCKLQPRFGMVLVCFGQVVGENAVGVQFEARPRVCYQITYQSNFFLYMKWHLAFSGSLPRICMMRSSALSQLLWYTDTWMAEGTRWWLGFWVFLSFPIFQSLLLRVSVCLCIYWSIAPTIHVPMHPSIYPSIDLSIYLSIHASLSLFVCLPIYYIDQFFYLFIHSSTCLRIIFNSSVAKNVPRIRCF